MVNVIQHGSCSAVDAIVQEREWLRLRVAKLELRLIDVDRAAVESHGRAGLESLQFETQPGQRPADAVRCAFAHASAGHLRLADVDQPPHERAGAEHDGPGAVERAVGHANAGDAERGPLPFRDQVVDRFLPQAQVRLFFAEAFDFDLVGPLIGLCPRAVHGGAFAAIEHAELDAGGVDGAAHGAAEGVDFSHDLSFGHAADGRIATHLADGIEIGGQERGLGPHAGRGQGRLGARMPAADDQNIVVVEIAHQLS